MSLLQDLGFNKFLNKQSGLQQIPADTADFLFDSFSAGKITSGVAQSANQRMNIDFTNGSIQIKDGPLVRAEMGKFIDEKIGLRVYDAAGNTVVNSTN